MTEYKVRVLKNPKEKLTGLLGKDQAHPVYFQTRWGIHTWGMKFPIDVLILDNENRVVKTAANLSPNRFFFWSPKYDRVLELPAGEIKNKRIKKGDGVNLI